MMGEKKKNPHAMYEIIEIMLKNVFFSLINVCASSKIDMLFFNVRLLLPYSKTASDTILVSLIILIC